MKILQNYHKFTAVETITVSLFLFFFDFSTV